MVDLEKISKRKIKNAETGELTTVDTLWKEKPCLIIFFRRWGCMYCRLWAKEVSEIAEVLQKRGVRLVGIGCQELGIEEFKEGGFFKGAQFPPKLRKYVIIYKKLPKAAINPFILESLIKLKENVTGFATDLFIDIDKEIYKDMGFKRYNVFSILTSLLRPESRAAISKGRALGVGGNLKGDGLQNGGALIVTTNGKVVFEFKQDGPAEQVPNNKFLEVLDAENIGKA